MIGVNKSVVQTTGITVTINQEITNANQVATTISASSSQVLKSSEELEALAGQLKDMVDKFTI